ncbi:elongation factor G-like protein EF-G2, partial [Nocardia nova]|nr:elongation factor G-like protein EF-G2 [Nocardia nova]
DAARADFDEMVTACADILGDGAAEKILPLHLPLYGAPGADGHRPVTGLIELLPNCVVDYASGEAVRREPTPAEAEVLLEARNRLIEGIIAESEDESLMDRYLDGEDLELATLTADLERAVARGSFHPVLFAAP